LFLRNIFYIFVNVFYNINLKYLAIMVKTANYIITPEQFLSRDERKQLLKTCKELNDLDLVKGRITWIITYMLVDLALYSGLRVSEIAALKLKDIQLLGKDPYLIVRNGKRGKKRTVYFDTELKTHLKCFISYKKKTLNESVDDDAPLFAGRGGNHCPPITLMKRFKVAVKKAGLREELSIHNARHTYATYLLHDSGNLKYVQKQLGHASIAMTAHYANILPESNGMLANSIKRD
jgi:site-specific recombinase XerD